MDLYLAAEILKEQSGRLTVRNNPREATTFTIWLPAEEQPCGGPEAALGSHQVFERPDAGKAP